MADQADKPTWAVATVARESPEVIRRFVSWHLDMGASEIVIYCDDPNDPNIDLVAHLAQVKCVRCTEQFWLDRKIAPDHFFTKRQNIALQDAYDNCKQEWLFICDADELLYVTEGTFSDLLAAQPEAVQNIIFRTAERVSVPHRPNKTFLRLAANRIVVNKIFGEEIAWTVQPRGGLIGHQVGKSVHRTGRKKWQIRQHFGQIRNEPVIDKVMDWNAGAAVMHLMSEDYKTWRAKFADRVNKGGWSMPRGLVKVLKDVVTLNDERLTRVTYEKLFCLDPDQVKLMRRKGFLVSPDREVDHAVARYFPETIQ